MQFFARDSVRAFLPAVALAICDACGGGGGDAIAPVETSAPTVATGNQAPTISGSAIDYAKVGVAYSFQPHATDADGDARRFLRSL